MLRWLTRFAIAGLAVGALTTPAALASNGGDESAVAGVRQATAAYHDLDKAVAAHYGRLLPCFDLPGVGGMGQHYVDTSRLDATIEANAAGVVSAPTARPAIANLVSHLNMAVLLIGRSRDRGR